MLPFLGEHPVQSREDFLRKAVYKESVMSSAGEFTKDILRSWHCTQFSIIPRTLKLGIEKVPRLSENPQASESFY